MESPAPQAPEGARHGGRPGGSPPSLARPSICGGGVGSLLCSPWLVIAVYLFMTTTFLVVRHTRPEGQVVANRQMRVSMVEGLHDTRPPLEQSSRFPTGSVKTLDEIVRTGKVPRTLLTHAEMDFCPNVTEPETSTLYRIPPRLKMLMLIGTQKTGTTWLFEALMKNPYTVPAVRTLQAEMYRREARLNIKGSLGDELKAKEPQYFNRWPLPPVGDYLHAWSPEVIGNMLANRGNNSVLLDASPQYLMNALAPARIQAVAPHAKFITVIRDGPMRTWSDYKMMSGVDCAANPSRLCPLSDFEKQVVYELQDPKWRPECFFNGTGPSTTWWDCHRCHFGFVDRSAGEERCAQLRDIGPQEFNDCDEPSHRFIDHGLYAAQLAWWLRFFPPEQFYIVSSWQLRDPVERVRVMNDILAFAGLPTDVVYTAKMLDGISGFKGSYGTDFKDKPAAVKGLAALREFFEKPQEDLKRLVDTFWPELNFTIQHET